MKNKALAKIIISVVIFSIVFCTGLLIMGKTAAAVSQPDKTPDLALTYNLSGYLNDVTGKELVIMFSRDMKTLGGERDAEQRREICGFRKETGHPLLHFWPSRYGRQ